MHRPKLCNPYLKVKRKRLYILVTTVNVACKRPEKRDERERGI